MNTPTNSEALPPTAGSTIFELRGAYLLPPHSPKFVTTEELAEAFLEMEVMSPTSEVQVRSGTWEFENHWKPKWVPHVSPQNDIAQAPPAQENQEEENATAGGCLPRPCSACDGETTNFVSVSQESQQWGFSASGIPESSAICWAASKPSFIPRMYLGCSEDSKWFILF